MCFQHKLLRKNLEAYFIAKNDPDVDLELHKTCNLFPVMWNSSDDFISLSIRECYDNCRLSSLLESQEMVRLENELIL